MLNFITKPLSSKCICFFPLLGTKGKCGKSAFARNDSFPMVPCPANNTGQRKQNSCGNSKNYAYCVSIVCSLHPHRTLPREGHRRHADIIFAFCLLRIPKMSQFTSQTFPHSICISIYSGLDTVLEYESSMMKKKDSVPMKLDFHHENRTFLCHSTRCHW